MRFPPSSLNSPVLPEFFLGGTQPDGRFVLVTGGLVSRATTGYGVRPRSSASQSISKQASLAAKAPRVLVAAEIEDYGATPPAMNTPGRRAITIGFTVTLLSVSVGMHFGAGGFGLLRCFMGALIGSSLVAVGVRMADGPAPVVPVVFNRAHSLATFVRRNAFVVESAIFGNDIGISEYYGATPPATRTPGRRAMDIGFIVTLLSVSVGMHFGAGGFGLLLCFVGILVGSSLVAAGVRMADGPAPVVRVVFDGARSVAAFVRRNAAAKGLVLASCAVTIVSGEADPVLCFATIVLLLLGVSLIITVARGE